MGKVWTALLIALPALCNASVAADFSEGGDWPWWRGPERNGVAAAGQQPPVHFSSSENVIWKTPVPGRGHSSPTVVGERIFLATADEVQQRQYVLAFDRQSGQPLWQTEISRGGFPKKHRKNTYATCTVACDGTRLFVVFHHHARLTLAAVDLDGEELWSREMGPYDPKVYEYGYAPSPVVYDSLVIVAADWEKGGYLAAYDRVSGEPVWRTDRPEMLSFSSPVVGRVAGRDQLLLCGCERVASYDPRTGRELWSAAATTMATAGTVVWEGDLVFASGGFPDAQTVCVRGDGSGKVEWKHPVRCYEQSLVAHRGHVYAVSDQGIAYCWRAADGREMWRRRLGGPVAASPVVVGERIYISNEKGTTFVFGTDPEQFQLLAENQLEEEAFATPAICGSRIYARVASGRGTERQESLYCLGSE